MMNEKVRVIVRGYLGRDVVFANAMHRDVREIGELLPRLAEEHAAAMVAGTLSMVEIEFPDDPPEERFFRIGVDPSGMVMPVRVMP
jgi:hypothetical protein